MGQWLETFIGQKPRLALLGLLSLFVLLVGVIILSPTFVSLPVVVLTAVAWCWLLEGSTAFAATSAP